MHYDCAFITELNSEEYGTAMYFLDVIAWKSIFLHMY